MTQFTLSRAVEMKYKLPSKINKMNILEKSARQGEENAKISPHSIVNNLQQPESFYENYYYSLLNETMEDFDEDLYLERLQRLG